MANPFLYRLTLNLFLILLNLINISALCAPDSSHGHVNDTSELAALARLSALQGETWEWDSYVLGVCPSQLLKHKSAGAVRKIPKSADVVLGRTNVTHAASSEKWVLVSYRGGDSAAVSPCFGNYTAEIIIICDEQQSHKGTARFVEQDCCVTRFEIATSAICPPEGPSVSALIFAWSVFLLTLYCLVGILYRRFKLRMRGRQQLPHLPFWSQIGRGCADCSNWACRCEEDTVDTWDADTDRDDVLLRP